MRTNLTDTQKFHLGNDIAKRYTGQSPAYGVDHHETVKVKVVREPMKTKKLNEHIEIAILILAIVSCPGVLLLVDCGVVAVRRLLCGFGCYLLLV